MKAIIIDDEEHCITTLKWTLQEYCKDVEIIGAATNGHDAIELINALNPDLVFLDIEMPNLKGIDVLAEFKEIHFDVIFTTAYDKYAIKAIKLNALDYLLKPIDKDELIEAIKKVKSKQTLISKEQINVLQEFHKTKIANKIALSTMSGLQFINLDNLVRIEGDGNYSTFIFSNKKPVLVSKKLGDVEAVLNDNSNFFRGHKSHIINLKFVDRYIRGDGGEVVMEDGMTISISRQKKEDFLKLFDKI